MKIPFKGVRRAVPLLVACALFASACGDDGGGDGGGAATTAPGGTAGPTTTVVETPVVGGEMTALLFSEIGTLDPVKGTGSGGSDGQRMFAIYGALMTLDGNSGEMKYVQAESFKLKTPTDATVWVMKLRPGMKFSDGTVFDANAVKVNWERAADPANACSCRGDAATIKSMTIPAGDPLTLEVTLAAPNPHFDKAVERVVLNYIASPKAIADKLDMTSKPVGAGPFLLEQWIRDDRMVMVRNPDWVGKPGPYLNKLTFRTVGDETQRVDTFATGSADLFYTSVPGSVQSAQSKVKDAYYSSVAVTTGQTFLFNTRIAPFNDQRVRQAFVQAVDFKVLAREILNDSVPAEFFTPPSSPWHNPNAALPKYDPVNAQKLVDAYVAEKGPIKFTWLAFEQVLDQNRAKFMQTSLNQLKNFTMDIQVNPSAVNINKVIVEKSFQASSWGFPVLDPEPTLYGAVKTNHARNYSGYVNAAADKAVEDARNPAIANDLAARKKFYDIVWEALAKDLPYVPYIVTTNGFVCAPKTRGCTTYEDGILRWDLIWKKA
jgi:peptide/nickel transport system substrate-binding protein